MKKINNPPVCKALSEENGIGQYPVCVIHKPQKFPGGACPQTPPRTLCFWHAFRKSASIFPRSAPVLVNNCFKYTV